MKMVDFSPIHQKKTYNNKVVAVDLWSVWTVRMDSSFGQLRVVITTRRLSVASFAIDHPSLGRNNNGQFVVFTFSYFVGCDVALFCWRTFACTPKAPFLPFHTPQ
jgi:hypothetical protein